MYKYIILFIAFFMWSMCRSSGKADEQMKKIMDRKNEGEEHGDESKRISETAEQAGQDD